MLRSLCAAAALAVVVSARAQQAPPALYDAQGHAEQTYVTALAVSPDGRYVATGGADGYVLIWEAETGRKLREWELREQTAAVAFLPDGRGVLVADAAGEVRVVDLVADRVRVTLPHPDRVTSAVLLAGGGEALTASAEGHLRRWRLTDRELLATFGDPGRPLRIVSAARLEGLGDVVATLEEGDFDGGAVGLAPDWSGDPSTLALWSADGGARLAAVPDVHAAALCPDFSCLVYAQGATLTHVLGRPDRPEAAFRTMILPVDDVSWLAVRPGHPDHVVVGTPSRTLLWDLAREDVAAWYDDPEEAWMPLWSDQAVAGPAVFDASGERLLLGPWGTAVLLDPDDGRFERLYGSVPRNVGGMGFDVADDGALMVVGAQAWDLDRMKRVTLQDANAPAFVTSDGSAAARRLLTVNHADGAALWDLADGQLVRRYTGKESGDACPGAEEPATAFAPEGRAFLLAPRRTASAPMLVRYAAADGDPLGAYAADLDGAVCAAAFSPDGAFVGAHVRAGGSHHLLLWHVGGTLVSHARLAEPRLAPAVAAVSADGATATLLYGDGTRRDVAAEPDEAFRRRPEGAAFASFFERLLPPRFRLLSAVEVGAAHWLRPPEDGFCADAWRQVGGPQCVPSPDGTRAFLDLGSYEVGLFDTHTGARLLTASYAPDFGNATPLEDEARYLRGGRVLLVQQPGALVFYRTDTGAELARVVFDPELVAWTVIAPDGRFDLASPEDPGALHWVMEDGDALRSIPVEAFMRDYFEPNLLPRLLAGEALPPLPDLGARRLAQPAVEVVAVEPLADDPAVVAVTVEVRRGGGGSDDGGGAHDLRLFRNGQLVGWQDGPLALDAEGRARVRFARVALPTAAAEQALPVLAAGGAGADTLDFLIAVERLDPDFNALLWGRNDEGAWPSWAEAVARAEALLEAFPRRTVFTAYAFNADGVKSPTARRAYVRPADVPPRQRRAFIVSLGVDAFDDPAWDLRYAAADADAMQAALSEALRGAADEVVAVPLLASRDRSGTVATKAALRAVLGRLAGEPDDGTLAGVPGADRLTAATPDDLVIVTAATHGFADADGTHYLFPSDIGSGDGSGSRRVTPERLARAVSSDELSAWLRNVDAGELILVVDACHAAAAVEGAGFKPGPWAGSGLGRLAYQKGMRVVVASQAEDVAVESGRLGHGLLTFALAVEGLAGAADREPADGLLRADEWLRYGADRVPALYDALRLGDDALAAALAEVLPDASRSDVIGAVGGAVQQPVTYDYRRVPAAVLRRR